MVAGGLPLVVAGAGAVLVAASPERPAQPVPGVVGTGWMIRRRTGGLISLQVSGISPSGGGWRACSVAAATARKAWASMARVTQRYQERPAADLVLVQAGQALAGLEVLLHRPAAAGDLDQGGQRDRARARSSGRRPARRCAGCGGSAATGARPAGVAMADPGPVVVAVALGALRRRSSRCQAGRGSRAASCVGAAARRPRWRPGGPGHRQHVADLAGLQLGAQRPGRRRRPRRRPPRRPGPRRPARGRSSACASAGLVANADAVRDAGRLAALRVAGPGPGQVQLPVDQRVPARRGIGQVDRDLGVLDPPGGAGVLALHPDACAVPFFRSPVSSTTSTAPGSPRCSTT